jgi:hypothetical protein
LAGRLNPLIGCPGGVTINDPERGFTMTFYEKDEIRPGIFMVKDATGVGPAYVKRSTPRYGDPAPLAEVSKRLEVAHRNIEALVRNLRNARR